VAGTRSTARTRSAYRDPARPTGQPIVRPPVWALLAVPTACAVAVLAGALLSVDTSRAAASLADAPPAGSLLMPDRVGDLPAQDSGARASTAEDLADRLREDPAVADAVAAVYGNDDGTLLVVRVAPVAPFDEEGAGRLTARVLGAAGPERGMSDDFRASASEDGDALVTCSTLEEGTATCVSVEPTMALLVLSNGLDDDDPVALAEAARTAVLATG
jgi:hypothetical protein